MFIGYSEHGTFLKERMKCFRESYAIVWVLFDFFSFDSFNFSTMQTLDVSEYMY